MRWRSTVSAAPGTKGRKKKGSGHGRRVESDRVSCGRGSGDRGVRHRCRARGGDERSSRRDRARRLFRGRVPGAARATLRAQALHGLRRARQGPYRDVANRALRHRREPRQLRQRSGGVLRAIPRDERALRQPVRRIVEPCRVALRVPGPALERQASEHRPRGGRQSLRARDLPVPHAALGLPASCRLGPQPRAQDRLRRASLRTSTRRHSAPAVAGTRRTATGTPSSTGVRGPRKSRT